MPDSPVPSLLAILICDQVISDAETKKKTVVGIFDTYASARVPFGANLAVYARVIDLDGTYKFKFRLANLRTEQPIIDMETSEVRWTNPRAAFELGVNFRNLPIQEFGTYEFQLYANEVYIGRAVMNVTQMQLPRQGPGQPPQRPRS